MTGVRSFTIPIFIFFFFQLNAFSAVKEFKIIVDDNGVRDISHTDKRLIKKSAYEVIFFTKKFDLLLNDTESLTTSENTYGLKIQVRKLKNQNYDLQFQLKDMSTNKLINIETSKSVSHQRIQYLSRKMLMKLFYGQMYIEQEDRLKENKIIPLKKKSKNAQKSSKSSKELKKSSAIAQSGSDELTEEEEPFFDELVDDKVAKKKKKKKKKQVVISDFESPNIDISKESNAPERFVPTNIAVNYNTGFMSGYNKSETISDSIIKTTTNTNQITLAVKGNRRKGDSRGQLTFGAQLGKIVGDNEYGLSPDFLLSLGYEYDVYKRYLFVGVNANYEKSSFANLSTVGEGIVPWSNSLVWVGPVLTINLFNENLKIYGEVSTSFTGSSDLGTKDESFPINGSRMKAGVDLNVYKKWGLGLYASTKNLNSTASKDFKAETSSVGLEIVYR